MPTDAPAWPATRLTGTWTVKYQWPCASSTKRARPKRVIAESVGIPHAEVDAGEADRIADPSRGPTLEGNPAERTALAAAPAPAQPRLAGRLALGGVLSGDLVDGRRTDQVEFLTGAYNERGEVEWGEEPTFTTQDLDLVRIAGVPDSIDLERHALEDRHMPVLDADLQGLDRNLWRTAAPRTRHSESIANISHVAGRFSSPP